MYKRLLKGMTLTSIGVILAKIISVFAFYFVGLFLEQEQLGSYASIVGLMAVVLSLQTGGISQLMVQRGVINSTRSELYINFAIIVNLVMLVISACIIVLKFDNANHVLIATGLVFNAFFSFGSVYAYLTYSTQENFIAYAKLEVSIALVQYMTLIISVLCFKSEIAYGISFFSVGVVNIILIFRFLPKIRIKFSNFWKVFYHAKHIIISNFVIHYTINSPYLIVSLLSSQKALGAFFIVNQTLYSLSGLLIKPIQSVVLPILTNVKKEQHEISMSELLTKFGLIIIPLFLLLSSYISYFVHFIWQGKWDHLANTFSIAALAVSIKVISNFYWPTLEVQGHWSLKMRLLVIEAILTTCMIAAICIVVDNTIQASSYIFIGLSIVALIQQVLIIKLYALKLKLLLIIEFFAIIIMLLKVGFIERFVN